MPSGAEASEDKLSFICPDNYLPGSICLPCIPSQQVGTRTSSPQTILYVAFQHARFTRKWCYHQKPWALTPHFQPHPYPRQRRGRRQLFSVALSVTSTYFSASVEIPGYSPVHCSVLSGLSSSRLWREAIAGLQRTANLANNLGLLMIMVS